MRVRYIDNCSGLLIIYMIFTHIIQFSGLENDEIYQYSFRVFYFFMPWFFFKSGQFLKVNYNSVNVVKLTKKLLYPLLFYTIIGCLLFIPFGIKEEGSVGLYLLRVIKDFVYKGSTYANLPLWFLTSLFIAKVVLSKILSININVFIILLITLLFFFLIVYYDVCYPLLGSSFLGFLWIIFGYIYNKIEKYIHCKLIGFMAALYLFNSLFNFSLVDVRTCSLVSGNWVQWFLSVFSGIVIFNKIIALASKRNVTILYKIGSSSMFYYCSHWLILLVLKYYIIPQNINGNIVFFVNGLALLAFYGLFPYMKRILINCIYGSKE